VTRAEKPGVLHVSIVPVHVFPVLDPDRPGTIVRWERREYDDRVEFDAVSESRPHLPTSKDAP
jgi:hypothetical protein